MTWGTKTCHPKKFEQGALSNWCDADQNADADSSKTICRPPPYGGVDIIKSCETLKNLSNFKKPVTCNIWTFYIFDNLFS